MLVLARCGFSERCRTTVNRRAGFHRSFERDLAFRAVPVTLIAKRALP
jgi:hypothetical protein